MLDDFITQTLAHIDDFAELKVSLVALYWLEQKHTASASVTMDELANHPALRNGLGSTPNLTLEYALRKAIARGTLLATSSASNEDLKQAKLFANNAPSRELIEVIKQQPVVVGENIAPENAVPDKKSTLLMLIVGEIERLEMIEVYGITLEEDAMVEEWLARGYTQEEIISAVRAALRTPRHSSAAPRGLRQCEAQVKARLPRNPSLYYEMIVTKSKPLREEFIAFRELSGRLPTGREFNQIRAAVGLHGVNGTVQLMRRVVSKDGVDVDALIPMLAEQQDAELSLARRSLQTDVELREITQLYETTFGLPATSSIVDDVRALLRETSDINIWRAAFVYAIQQNKRNWPYVRAIVRNPTPDLLTPAPVNETAKAAFALYRQRVDKAGKLDVSVARQINEVAQTVTDVAAWERAIDTAANANALNWNYIKAVLTRPIDENSPAEENKHGKRKTASQASRSSKPSSRSGKSGGSYRRPQVESTDEERAADEERARALRAEMAERKRKRQPSP